MVDPGIKSLRRPWRLPVLVGLLVAAASACSDPVEPCNPPIPPGARYRVTLGAETPNSNGCHVVRMDRTPTFEVIAGAQVRQAGRQACLTTPAAAAPQQQSIVLVECRAAEAEQLGTFCDMLYPSSCQGLIWFFFDAPQGGPPVNWSAPVIDAVFKIRDQTTGCIPGGSLANCTDEYFARLERLP